MPKGSKPSVSTPTSSKKTAPGVPGQPPNTQRSDLKGRPRKNLNGEATSGNSERNAKEIEAENERLKAQLQEYEHKSITVIENAKG